VRTRTRPRRRPRPRPDGSSGGEKKKTRPTYRGLEQDPSYEHAVDQRVRIRVGRRDLQRTVSDTSSAIVKALGKQRRLWFRFEHAADKLRSLREAAYFDAGVEHGAAAARADAARDGGRAVRRLAEKLVVEALRRGLDWRDAAAATVLAAWAMSGARSGKSSRAYVINSRAGASAPP
jgi:hypothetical protein